MKKSIGLASLIAALMATAAPVHAQTAGLNGWTAVGDVTINFDGDAARLSTASSASAEVTLSGSAGAAQWFDLEPLLSLVGGTLAADTLEGSGLFLGFDSAPDRLIRFDWLLSTAGFDGSQLDRAFVVIDGATVVPLGTIAAADVSGSFSHTFNTQGDHALAIVVMDVDAYDRVSTLALSGFSVSAVPEPGSLALLLAGAVGLAGVRGSARRRRV